MSEAAIIGTKNSIPIVRGEIGAYVVPVNKTPYPRARGLPLSQGQKARILWASCDMSRAYTGAIQHHCPNATPIIDRFHVVKALNQAVDEVRKDEWRALDSGGRRRSRACDGCSVCTLEIAPGDSPDSSIACAILIGASTAHGCSRRSSNTSGITAIGARLKSS